VKAARASHSGEPPTASLCSYHLVIFGRMIVVVYKNVKLIEYRIDEADGVGWVDHVCLRKEYPLFVSFLALAGGAGRRKMCIFLFFLESCL